MKELQLQNSTKLVLVDDEDFERLSKFKWFLAGEQTVIQRTVRTSGYGKARYIPIGNEILLNFDRIVDHKSRDIFNCQKDNLRLCDIFQNAWNKRLRTDSKSGYKGVSLHTQTKKWHANIMHKGTVYSLGLHADIKDAAKAYNAKALELFGEFAVLNTI